jgi:CRP/FNR family cyclic AMP-dependent transcriptional regulator
MQSNNYQQLTLPANSVIFEEDAPGDTAYLLKSGQVELTKHIHGVSRRLTTLKAPVMFGEMALIMPQQKRTAGAKTLTECELVVITQSIFKQFIDASPQMMKTAMELLVQRLKVCTDKVLHVPSVDSAVLHNLSLLNAHGINAIDYNLFLQEMANILLQPQQRIEQTLQKLIQAELIDKRKGQFTATELVFVQKQDFINKARQALATAS